MNHCSCSGCRWGSDEPENRVWCYVDMHTHQEDDCCKEYEPKPNRDFGPKKRKPE